MTSLPRKTLELISWGYDVTRWHTFPNLRPQNLASHSWGVAMMAMSLFDGTPDDKLLLVQAALEHDLVEKHIGDMPRPGRTDEHRLLERTKADEHGTFHESLLPPHLREWLEWADLIEAGLHGLREDQLGNRNFCEVLTRISNILEDNKANIPSDLWEFAVEAGLVEGEL
jgi:5'-deoxynucleotidase YfbR-like HD superfamily hydrolase